MTELGRLRTGPNGSAQGGIYTGDARVLAQEIPDASIDLVLTDPVYDRVEDYRWLAQMAARVLVDRGSLVAFCGIGYAPATIAALCEHMDYRWMLTGNYAGRKQFHGRLQVSMTMAAWMEKGKGRMFGAVGDNTLLPTVQRFGRYRQGGGASWGKHPKIIRRYIEGFAPVGGIVLDCFAGSGVVPALCKLTGRGYVAFEIKPDVAEMARERVRWTQWPLEMPELEQTVMELEAAA